MITNLIHLEPYFRDEDQLQAVRNIIHERLADDRHQDECRYLMRFWWQFSVGYQEVTLDELKQFVSAQKLEAIYRLLEALESGHSAIDEWIREGEAQWPLVTDRGYLMNEAADRQN